MGDIMTIGNVRGYVAEDGIAWLNAEDVARGWGFTQMKSGVEYVKWERVNGYLKEFGFSPQVGKGDFLPENMVYRLGFKANNEAAQIFQTKLADEILPAIRKTGAYGAPYILIMKRYKKRPVLSTADVAALLGTARESIGQTLQEPLAKCKNGHDYFLVQGGELVLLKRDNPSISSLASSVLLITESGLRKVCAHLKKAMPAVFSAPSVVDALPMRASDALSVYTAPESNKEISAWVKDIRGYMDVLDGLLHKYEQQNPVKTQDALKEVMRSVGQDIWEDVVRLTCQKYDLVTI